MDNEFRNSISLLRKMFSMTTGQLNELARDKGVRFKERHESLSAYIEVLWQGITKREDFDQAYSTLSLLDILKDDRSSETKLRERIQSRAKDSLDKSEEGCAEPGFLKMLKSL